MPVGDRDKQIVGYAANTSYSDEYKEAAFFVWYKMNCPSIVVLAENLPVDEMGRVPVPTILHDWKKLFDWDSRADVLNQKVAERVEIQAVEDRVQMLKKQAETAARLQEMGLQKLEESGFEHSADALRAVIQGAELERISRGLPTALLNISKMDDTKLADTIQKLMKQANNDEFITEANPDAVDGEIKDVSNE